MPAKKQTSRTVQETKLHLFNMVQPSQGWAFISNDETQCANWQELLELCERSAYHAQCVSNICRAVARTCKKKANEQLHESVLSRAKARE